MQAFGCRWFTALGTGLGLVFGLHGLASGEPPFPAGPVKIVVGFGAGGAPDTAARLLATGLSRRWSQPVVVENQVGASGTLAAASVARAKPDGSTLLFGVAANLSVAPAVMRQPPYDPVKSFTPVAEVARSAYVWLVRADAPVATMPEFIAWARREPGKLNYGSPGQGTQHHLATELMKRNEGVFMVHVPYRVAAYQGLLAGDIQGMLESLPAPLALIDSGRVRALAVTGPARLPGLPQVPTFQEQGLHELDVAAWWGVVGPAGLSEAVVARLHADIRAVLAESETRGALTRGGIELAHGTPEDFGAHIAREWQRWREVALQRELSSD
ncbi:tripartite tricarboxylate transporter substrate binding protein [Variovorax sp. KK3]|uniref:Bug family tripartite tricarboxylate transporter substrate binding protein n=1 Tax=Variovorax sp. KK3 TaxID=1855728 RepID=UPI00097C59BD|nr:tripartite tricarboxylate transporter substrate binding protein [Variovorax sp. KK3]